MSPGSWVLYGVLLLSAGSWVFFVYRHREVRVGGLRLLGGLRFASLAILLLLLFDPRLPVTGAAPGAARSLVLVDRSLSMSAEGDAGTPWATALDRARSIGAPVLFFGEDVRSGEALDDPPGPTDTRSLLAPALERAAESGAREVRVVGDLRVEDPAAARAVARRTGLRVATEDVGGGAPGAAMAELRLPRVVASGRPVPAELVVAVTGGSLDSVTVEVREEGRLVASRTVAAAAAGRVTRLELELPPPSVERPGGEASRGGGDVRYTARVRVETDRFPLDDERVTYTDVDPAEGNLVLISHAADWEPRFLLPVLARVTGLPVRGYLRVGPDRYLVMDAGGGAGTVPAETVERQAGGAELLVVHGMGGSAAEWLVEAVERAPRAVVFADGREGAAAAGLTVDPPRGGEWYVSPQLPTSPLAGELSGLDLRGLPPVTNVLAAPPNGELATPLTAQLNGSGPAEPVLVLVRGPEGRRRAVVLADGLWRWAFRTESSRQTYRRLWAGVAGWLLADPASVRGSGVRPVARVVARGGALELSAPGAAGQPLRLRLERDDTVVVDTTMAVSESGALRLEGLPPGAYRYRATEGDGEVAVEHGGRFDVEGFSPELLHPRVTDLDIEPAVGEDARTLGPAEQPLRTHPLPYLALLGLLCAEWIGRRRKGLR